jgi:hypothetical protein
MKPFSLPDQGFILLKAEVNYKQEVEHTDLKRLELPSQRSELKHFIGGV